MSLNPIVYLQLAILAVVFVGAALFVFALARRPRNGDAPVVDTEEPRAALLASVSILGSRNAAETPQRFWFSTAGAPSSETSPGNGTALNLHTRIDALLLQRISEFLQRQTTAESTDLKKIEGCVIVVADALPPAVAAQSGAPHLNGASAVLVWPERSPKRRKIRFEPC